MMKDWGMSEPAGAVDILWSNGVLMVSKVSPLVNASVSSLCCRWQMWPDLSPQYRSRRLPRCPRSSFVWKERRRDRTNP